VHKTHYMTVCAL